MWNFILLLLDLCFPGSDGPRRHMKTTGASGASSYTPSLHSEGKQKHIDSQRSGSTLLVSTDSSLCMSAEKNTIALFKWTENSTFNKRLKGKIIFSTTLGKCETVFRQCCSLIRKEWFLWTTTDSLSDNPEHTDPVFLNVYGAQKSIPRN
jgi:hypothetical protein